MSETFKVRLTGEGWFGDSRYQNVRFDVVDAWDRDGDEDRWYYRDKDEEIYYIDRSPNGIFAGVKEIDE